MEIVSTYQYVGVTSLKSNCKSDQLSMERVSRSLNHVVSHTCKNIALFHITLGVTGKSCKSKSDRAVTNYKSKAELKGFRLKMKVGKVNADYAC